MNDVIWYGGPERLRLKLQCFAGDAEAPEQPDNSNKGHKTASADGGAGDGGQVTVDSGKLKVESGGRAMLAPTAGTGDGAENGADPSTASRSPSPASRGGFDGAGGESGTGDGERGPMRASAPTAGTGDPSAAAGKGERISRCARNDSASVGEQALVRERLRARVRGELAAGMTRYRDVMAQTAALEEQLPGFSLEAELRDPVFARLLSAELPVQTAFEVVHHRQLQEAAFALAARRAAQSVAAALQQNERRPRESAVAPQAAAILSDDPKQLSRKERRELRERVRKGERVVW